MAQKKPANLGAKANKANGSKSSVSKTASAKKAVSKTATKPATRVAASKVSAKPLAKSTAKVGPNKSRIAPAKAAASPKSATKPVMKVASKPAAKTQNSAKPAQATTAAKPVAVAKAPPAPMIAKVAPKAPAAQPRPAIAIEKAQGPKITGPAPAAAAVAARPPVAAKPAAPVEKKIEKPQFKVNEYVVYPSHGVGKVIGIEEEEIAGMKLELFKIEFEKERLVLRVPMGKVPSVGMRKIADDASVKRALETLKGRARVKRTMWSRRAQEYTAKINSGNLTAIAEVVRDLYRSEAQPEQSYSERQLYEDALERMAREVAIVERLDERGAVQRITEILSKSAKGRAAAHEGAAGDDDVKAA
ncbi:MAG: CarD family transcriptional regulator [Hyphomicrobiaceae bacterium]|nr:CarD family transcriptional regulator [Hyphomicrobiaceae bacterium]